MVWRERTINRWPGLRIRDLRARLGQSQADLARTIDAITGGDPPLQSNRVHKWERKGVRPHPRYQAALDLIERATPPPDRAAREGIDPTITMGSRR